MQYIYRCAKDILTDQGTVFMGRSVKKCVYIAGCSSSQCITLPPTENGMLEGVLHICFRNLSKM